MGRVPHPGLRLGSRALPGEVLGTLRRPPRPRSSRTLERPGTRPAVRIRAERGYPRGVPDDPDVAPLSATEIHPNRTLWLLSAAHAVNHAQAVIMPLIFLKIIDEFGVGVQTVTFIAAA